MTPKLKAEELVYKMHNVDFHDLPDELAMQYVHAKQCAIIAVDYILNSEPGKAYFIKNYWITPKTYWQEVKKEILEL